MRKYAIAAVAATMILSAYADRMERSPVPGTVVGWGYNNMGQTNCQAGTNYSAVAAGYYHSLAQRSDGTLVGWGSSGDGEIACPTGTNYAAISAGSFFSIALRTDGMIVGWGRNDAGQIGCPAGSNFIAIAAGFQHSLALRSNGTIVGWGRFYEGETDCPADSNFVAVAAGHVHSLALRNDGTLVAWGATNYGQTNCPAGSNYVAIAAGVDHSLALRSDGTLVGWGRNDSGQADCPAGSNYVAIAAGWLYSLAVQNNGTMVGWGDNSIDEITFPACSNYVALSAGYLSSLGLRADPFVTITSESSFVNVSIPTVDLAGISATAPTPHLDITGDLWWTNHANGAHGSLAASQSWTIPDIPLAYGENTITVHGTNVCHVAAQDCIVVTRGHVALVAPQDGVVTSTPILFLDAFYSTAMVCRVLITNTEPVLDPATAFAYTNTVIFPYAGVYYWTAVGYDAASNAYHAPQTNQITVTGPRVRLVSPPDDTVLTNVFACALVADYDTCDAGRQLSTNNGVSWFDYDPLSPVVFAGAGTYHWMARGFKDGAWWCTKEINTLVIHSNFPGDTILLMAPAQGSLLTTSNVQFSAMAVTAGFSITEISIDNQAFAVADFPVTLPVNPGVHTWTARCLTPGPAYTYAPSTNTFSVFDPATSGITLVAPVNGAVLEQNYVFFDLLRCSVEGVQLSTNNGVDWFAYHSPLEVPKGRFQWTARGTNAAGEWVYASTTNTVHLYDPLIAITDPSGIVTVQYAMAGCTISGTNNLYVKGSIWWTNSTTHSFGAASRAVGSNTWSFMATLAEGMNVIRVMGTNVWGQCAGDDITLFRVHEYELPKLDPVAGGTVREHQVLLRQLTGRTTIAAVRCDASMVQGTWFFDTNAWRFSCVPALGTASQVWTIAFVGMNQYGAETQTLVATVTAPNEKITPKTPLRFEDEDGDLLGISYSGVKNAGSIVLFDGQTLIVSNAVADGKLSFTIKKSTATGNDTFILRDVTMDNNGKSVSLAGDVDNVTMPDRTVDTLKFTSKTGIASNVWLGGAKTISAGKGMIVGTVAVSNGFETLSAGVISGARILSGVPASANVTNTPATRGFKTVKAPTMNNSVVAGRDTMNGRTVVKPKIKVKVSATSTFFHTGTNGFISQDHIVP